MTRRRAQLAVDARQTAFDAAEHYELTVLRPTFNGVTATALEYAEEMPARERWR